MKLVYIAGPLRAADTWSVEQNIQIVERLALDVFGLGAYPVYVHPFARYTEGRRALAMHGSLELMRRCDALILALDWGAGFFPRRPLTAPGNWGLGPSRVGGP